VVILRCDGSLGKVIGMQICSLLGDDDLLHYILSGRDPAQPYGRDLGKDPEAALSLGKFFIERVLPANLSSP
jgi:hypothetical protein